jgi:uncharacterized protein GlcG (DUF336 family)
MRWRVILDLATAHRIVEAAHAAAVKRSILVSATVVDAGGHLVAFSRMDGAVDDAACAEASLTAAF